MKDILLKTIRYVIYGSFFVPVVVLPSSFIFPFIVPKILLFRSLVFLMLAGFVGLLYIENKKYRLQFTLPTIGILLFLLSFTVSTFVGVDWYRSFWDNHERMLGLFTVFHYVLYYAVLTSVTKEWKEWRRLMRVFLGAGSLVMFIAVLQTYVNHDLLLNMGGTSRVSSTLGNSIYLSGYGLFLMFLGYLLAMKEEDKKTNGWFWYAVAGGALGFWGIFLGGTRGALLGLVAGLGTLLVSYMFALKGHTRLRQYIGVLLVLGVGMLGMFYAYRQTEFVKNIPAVGRLVNTEVSRTNTRIMAWEVAIDAWKEKPVFGWGPNNYYYAFNKYYRPEFLEHGWGETWFDNAHSVIMNTLAVQGLVGIIAYLGLYGVVIILLWSGYKKGTMDIHVASVGTAFLMAHLISLVTVFDNPTSYLYFFFFLAFLNVQISDSVHEERTSKVQKQRALPTGGIVIVLAITALFIFSTDINPARANTHVLSLIRTIQSNPQESLVTYKDVSSIPTPHIDDIRNDVAKIAMNLLRDPQSKSLAWRDPLMALVAKEIEKNITLHPLDIRSHIILSEMYLAEARDTQNIQYVLKAEELIRQALTYSPKRQQLEYTLASILQAKNDLDGAVEVLKASLSEYDGVGHGWWRLALIQQQMGHTEEAFALAKEALGREDIEFDEYGLNVMKTIMASQTDIAQQ